jgi:flagellar hook-length control protein FliK
MVGQGEQSASLTLNPPDLGPLQVVLTLSQTQASADFSSAQPEVRQALQDALPRLREMLADAGISLGQANVHAGAGDSGQSAQQGSQASGGQRGTGGPADKPIASNDSNGMAESPMRQGLGLVNTYV